MWYSSSLLSKVSCFLGNHSVVLLRYLCCSISDAFAFVLAPLLIGILANKTIWKDESCEESAGISLISLKLLRRTSIYRPMQWEPTQYQRIWHQRRIKKKKKELFWDWSLYYGLGQSDPQHIFELSEILINMKVGFCHEIKKKNVIALFSCEFTSHNSDFVSVMFTVSNEHARRWWSQTVFN